MNKRIKKLWIRALRSGRYSQGKHSLRTNSDYCCLGVLCDLYRKQTGQGKWSDRVFSVTRNDYSASRLPVAVAKWAELEESNPLLGRRLYASDLNDDGKSFGYIADRIEKYL